MRRAGGQATLEAVLVLPMMVLLMLGIVQLTLIGQARLMTEYAAFQAARAGIVWSGNPERMRDAALFALLPTFARTDSLERVAAALEQKPRLEVSILEAGEGDFDDGPKAPLTVKVRYDYELRVPFAAQALFHAGQAVQRDAARRYYLPLTATYAMQLQSTFNPKWRAQP